MASDSGIIVSCTWGELFANPVFRRIFLPTSLRAISRSPLLRALLFTPMVVVVYELVQMFMQNIWLSIGSAVFFWFLIIAVQKYFCWLEFMLLARSGTLSDYRNSGLSTGDLVLGVIYPSEIARVLSIVMVLAWWWWSAVGLWAWVLGAFILMEVLGLRKPPTLLVTEVESYLRKRSPLALFFISLSVVVPLIIFFTIFLSLRFGIGFAAAKFAVPLSPITVFLIAFFLTMFLSRVPIGKWELWRLERFYSRYDSLEDLFEQFESQAEGTPSGK